jgi:hypothetical protein
MVGVACRGKRRITMYFEGVVYLESLSSHAYHDEQIVSEKKLNLTMYSQNTQRLGLRFHEPKV